MILNDVITEVRRIVQDEAVTFRISDVFMLALCNQGLKRIQLLRPDLFAFVGTVSNTENEVIQSAPTDSLRIIEIYSIVGGTGLVEANREVLDQTIPTWPNDTAGAAINWMRSVRNPNKYFIYPKAPAAQSLDIEYSQVPIDYDGTTAVALLSDAYFPAVVDIVVFLVESIDNEHVTTGRAKLFLDSFQGLMSVSRAAIVVTDTEHGGQDPTKFEVV